MLRSFKTPTAVICVVLVMLFCMVSPVSAATWTTIVPADYISDIYYAGNFRYVVFDFGRTPLISYSHNTTNGVAMGSVSLIPSVDGNYPYSFVVYPLGVRCIGGPPLSSSSSGSIAIEAKDFLPSAALTVTSNIKLQFDISHWSYEEHLSELVSLSATWSFHAYSGSGSYLGTVDSFRVDRSITLQDYIPGESFLYELPLDLSLDLSNITDRVSYIIPSCQVVATTVEDDPDLSVGFVRLSVDSFSISARTDMFVQESLTMEAIKDQLQDVNDKLDDIIDLPNQEKQEALEDGDAYVGELMDSLPDESAGFISGIRRLADSMSYEGTEAKLQVPSISLPEIPGVMKSYKLSDELDIDFGYWIEKLPAAILTLVQIVLTIALVVFAFKELYSTISYALTLKSGGDN